MTFRYDPSVVSNVSKNINAKSTGTTTIFTTIPVMNFAFISFLLEATTLTGAATGPTFSLGTNSTSFNNLIPSQTWSPTTQKIFVGYNVTTNNLIVSPGTAIVLNITNASNSTSMTLNVIVRGVYF